MMLDASLDTSFWNIASQIGVVPYLFDFFRVHYCVAVKREITTNPHETTLVYPQARLFQMVKEDGRLHLAEPERPILRLGFGEAHAISLAFEQSWWLLINDTRPLEFAEQLGIPALSVPDFCVLLFAEGKITLPVAQGYIQRVSTSTSSRLTLRAIDALAQLLDDEGAQP